VVDDRVVSFQVPAGEAFLPGFVRGFDQPLQAINLRRPTLDDVFLELMGRDIRDGDAAATVATAGG
jgi:ABC-2 type transport system ATP-binding protein